MLVYDITNEKSFDNIKNWIRNIEEVSFIVYHSFVLLLFCLAFLMCPSIAVNKNVFFHLQYFMVKVQAMLYKNMYSGVTLYSIACEDTQLYLM